MTWLVLLGGAWLPLSVLTGLAVGGAIRSEDDAVVPAPPTASEAAPEKVPALSAGS